MIELKSYWLNKSMSFAHVICIQVLLKMIEDRKINFLSALRLYNKFYAMSREGTEVGLCVLKGGVLRHYYETLGTIFLTGRHGLSPNTTKS